MKNTMGPPIGNERNSKKYISLLRCQEIMKLLEDIMLFVIFLSGREVRNTNVSDSCILCVSAVHVGSDSQPGAHPKSVQCNDITQRCHPKISSSSRT